MLGHDLAGDIYRDALPVLVVSLLAGLFAGTVLGNETTWTGIERVPGIWTG